MGVIFDQETDHVYMTLRRWDVNNVCEVIQDGATRLCYWLLCWGAQHSPFNGSCYARVDARGLIQWGRYTKAYKLAQLNTWHRFKGHRLFGAVKPLRSLSGRVATDPGLKDKPQKIKQDLSCEYLR